MHKGDGGRAEMPTNRTVFGIAWPLTLMSVMTHAIVVIDAYLVSDLGEAALAAMGLAAAVGGIVLGVLLSFSQATQIRIAQGTGIGRLEALKTGFYAGLTLNLAIAGLGVLGMLTIGRAIVEASAHTPAIAAAANRYLAVFVFVVLAEALAKCLTAYFNGCGEPRWPFYTNLAALPVNVGLSIVLIHGLFGAPELGVAGAAAGSAVGSALHAALLACRFHFKTRSFVDVRGWLHGTFATSLRRHLAFAWPIGATFVSATLATSVCAIIYARLPVNAFAALTLIMPWIMLAGQAGMSWAQATGIVVAQLLGRGAGERELDAFLGRAWRGAFVAAAVVAALYLAVILFSDRLYAELHDETREALWSFLPILLLLPFPKGSNAICGNTLRAAGETLYVMNVFVWAQWLFRVPATAALVYWGGVPVTWVFSLLLLEEILKLPAFHLRLFQGGWKRGVLN